MKDNPVVLLVDDNSDNLQLIANALKTLNCDLAFSDNPKEVMNQVKLIEPDLILMDIVMPEVDGYSLCCEIKATEAFKDIPVIFLTALDERRSLVRAFESGGIDYITKPYDMSELKARVGSHLKIKDGKEKLLEELVSNNAAIDVLLKKYNSDLDSLKETIALNVETLIKPYLQSLQISGLNDRQKQLVDIIAGNLDSVTTSLFGPVSSLKCLTATELKVANLIRLGKVNKEIAEMLCTSLSTVAFHRKNIREKLGLMNKKINLYNHLTALDS